MINDHPGRQRAVETLPVPYFRKEEFPLIIGGNTIERGGVQAGDLLFPGRIQVVYLLDITQDIAFIHTHSGGNDSVTVVVTAGHQVPGAGMDGLAVFLIIGIVQVRKTHHVAEFVAEGADSTTVRT